MQLSDPAWFDHVAIALAQHGLCGTVLQLELTHTRSLSDVGLAAERLSELRTLGVLIALDDFGSGNANIAYLRDLPVDAVKIDRRFVGGITSNDADRAVVRSMIALASELDINLIAKGVEQADQHVALVDFGCTFAQGRLYAPARGSDDLPRTVELPRPEHPIALADPAGAGLDHWSDLHDDDSSGLPDGASLALSAHE